MKTSLSVVLFFGVQFLFAQQIVELPYEHPISIEWKKEEKQYFTKIWNTQVVTNVSKPTLMVYKPSPEKQNGTSVVIAPGGGMYALSIENEGTTVAEWLVERGITAFVLKYRLVPTEQEDGIQDLLDIVERDNDERIRITKEVLPFSVSDGLNAISYVRTHSEALGVDPQKIGFMGFSAGGMVAFGVVNECDKQNRPNFLVPVYAENELIDPQPNSLTPPTLFVAAANDEFIDASQFTSWYDRWHKAGIRTEMHLYAKGGHGFGTMKKGLPVSKWLDRFYEWMVSEGL